MSSQLNKAKPSAATPMRSVAGAARRDFDERPATSEAGSTDGTNLLRAGALQFPAALGTRSSLYPPTHSPRVRARVGSLHLLRFKPSARAQASIRAAKHSLRRREREGRPTCRIADRIDVTNSLRDGPQRPY